MTIESEKIQLESWDAMLVVLLALSPSSTTLSSLVTEKVLTSDNNATVDIELAASLGAS